MLAGRQPLFLLDLNEHDEWVHIGLLATTRNTDNVHIQDL